MTVHNSITPNTQLLDDNGYDWAWAYVVYKEIPGRPGYCVGSDGSVWSRFKQVTRGGFGNGFVTIISGIWRRMKTILRKGGYLSVMLVSGERRSGFQVHRLVLEAFIGPCPEGMQACHDPDPTRTNNCLCNLRWGTPKENAADRIRHGHNMRGERNGNAKLTAPEVMEIRRLRDEGWSYGKLAKWFGISKRMTIRIVKGESWANTPSS